MRLKKVCPQCDATLHVRKLACPCGHVFPAKAQQMKRKRPIVRLRLHCSVSIATHQIAERGTCANQLTPRVLHFSALVLKGVEL